MSEYYYALDNSSPNIQTSDTTCTFTGIPNGSHNFYLKAKDNKGAYSPVASRSFSVSLSTLEGYQDTTASDGKVNFHSQLLNQDYVITAQDTSGVALSDIRINFYTNGDVVIATAIDPDGDYFPGAYLGSASRLVGLGRGQPVQIDIILFLLSIISTPTDVVTIWSDPPTWNPEHIINLPGIVYWGRASFATVSAISGIVGSFVTYVPSPISSFIAGIMMGVDFGIQAAGYLGLPTNMQCEWYYIPFMNFVFCIPILYPPNRPSIPSGPSSVYVGSVYSFSTSATDPDEDKIAYHFDWGDGTIEEWSSFIASGTVVSAPHFWYHPGKYYVAAQAKDIYGALSAWSESLEVSIAEPCTLSPTKPCDPDPDSGATDVSINADLSWGCGTSPCEYSVCYDVYFGTTNPPPKVSPCQGAKTYDPGTMQYSTTYYWRVVAKDDHGKSTSGDVWPFSTAAEPCTLSPTKPCDPNPASGATNVSINADLSWVCGTSPCGYSMCYDVYFGTTNPPPKVSTCQGAKTYDPGTMQYSTTYYWRVVAKDDHGKSTSGDVWPFSTKAEHSRGRIAFERHYQIYLINENGTGETKISDGSANDWSPAWSPDGTKIAFVVDGQIHLMNPDGSDRENISQSNHYDIFPAWWPDGSKLIFISLRDSSGVYIMNSDGTAQRPLFVTDAPGAEWDRAAVSPNGSQIAVTVWNYPGLEPGLHVLNSDGSNPQRFSDDAVGPAYSPDGTQIAFTTWRDGNAEVYVMNSNGTNQENRSNSPSSEDISPSWSPDGQRIVFVTNRYNKYYELCAMNPNGSDQQRITINSLNDENPSWGT